MYTLIKVVKGKASEVHPLMWVVTIAFLIFFGQAVLGQAISA
jgi:AGZA family xanthine/uracil permease-like MFS transporter